MSYPDTPGYRDGDTSKLAAESMEHAVPSLRERVMVQLCKGPKTVYEVADALGGLAIHTVGPRITELKLAGRVRDTGERRQTPTGRLAKVMACVPGREHG